MSDKIVFSNNRPTKIIELPSYKGSQVEIYASLLAKDLMDLDRKDELSIGLSSIHKFIKSWNFTDDTGADWPLTRENVLNLSAEDITFLMEQIKDFATEEKKDLPA